MLLLLFLFFFFFFLLLLLILIWFIYPFVALLEVTHWVRQNTPVYLSALLQGKVYLVGGFWLSHICIVVLVTPVFDILNSITSNWYNSAVIARHESINQWHYLQCMCQTSSTPQLVHQFGTLIEFAGIL